ncbi:MAG: type II secretion system F family protein [Deltaproteobacteria bacterium]|nr:type II secretion system F family protein [Deltaproteobacteria bacterium]
MAISLNHKNPRFDGKVLKAPHDFVSARRGGIIRRFGSPIKPSELIFFTSQLSLMLEIGASLNDALKAIEKQTTNTTFKEVIHAMFQDITEGRQLSDAMKRHPRVFDSVFTSMVKAGETGGFLKQILDRIVEMKEKRQALIAQLKTTLTYPAFLCVIGALVVVFILVGVLPNFTAFFEGKEHILPFTTRFLMAMSASMRGYWWAYMISGAGLALCLKLCKESDMGQAVIDRFFVSGPLIARICNKIYTCQLLRTLGHLLESQVPLLEALKVTRGTMKNRNFRHFIDQIADHVQQGGRFSQLFATYPYVLESVKQMVATGEEAGNLSKVMLRLAEFYDTEVDQDLKGLAPIIEPIALLVLGAVVGTIVLSVILPMFKLAQAIH